MLFYTTFLSAFSFISVLCSLKSPHGRTNVGGFGHTTVRDSHGAVQNFIGKHTASHEAEGATEGRSSSDEGPYGAQFEMDMPEDAGLPGALKGLKKSEFMQLMGSTGIGSIRDGNLEVSNAMLEEYECKPTEELKSIISQLKLKLVSPDLGDVPQARIRALITRFEAAVGLDSPLESTGGSEDGENDVLDEPDDDAQYSFDLSSGMKTFTQPPGFCSCKCKCHPQSENVASEHCAHGAKLPCDSTQSLPGENSWPKSGTVLHESHFIDHDKPYHPRSVSTGDLERRGHTSHCKERCCGCPHFYSSNSIEIPGANGHHCRTVPHMHDAHRAISNK